jgi:membrane protein involved in colicin uptake
MKQFPLLAAAALAALIATPAMALRPVQSPAGSVIDVIVNRDASVDAREDDEEWRKSAKEQDKRERKRAKELRKEQHEREKDLREAKRERAKDAREHAREHRRD